MADWIEYRKALRDHVKVRRLAGALSIPYAHALGLVSCLWLWAIDNASDGNLNPFSDEELAYAAKWDGAVNGFRTHLTEIRWLDPDGRLHDWEKHGTRLLREAKTRTAVWRRRQQHRKKKIAARTAT